MKYCDDARCPQFDVGECKLGFNIKLRLPKDMADAVYHNWGYVPPKVCRNRDILKEAETKDRLQHDRKPYHLAKLIARNGDVSPLCATTPKKINLKRANWTTDPEAVTCNKCKALITQTK